MTAADDSRACRGLAPEDVARADLYGLLARLFYGGPDAALMTRLGGSAGAFGGPSGALGRAWDELSAAARASDAASEGLAYDETFIGTGKAVVSLYASHYLTETYRELTLVKLRDTLRTLRLGRQDGRSEPEDHMSGLLDVMRHLVLRGDDQESLLAQKAFFDSWLAPVVTALREAVESAGASRFYCGAAEVLSAFAGLEREAFGIASC